MMIETPSPDTPVNPLELAIPVSDRVQIKNVLIIESRTKRGEDERFTAGGFGLKYHQTVEKVDADQDTLQISVRLTFSVVTTMDGEPEPDPTLLIDATLVLVYSLDSLDGLEDQNFQAFALTNGVYNAWPYWREFVQSATVRMGLPALVPPVFRFSRPSSPPTPVKVEEPAD